MSAIICDIDGTLLLNGEIPIKKTIDYIKEMESRYQIFLVTGRPELAREKTVASLKNAGITYHRLMMNSIGNKPEDQLKSKSVAASNILFVQRVMVAIDNDPKARKVYAGLKIKTLDPRKI